MRVSHNKLYAALQEEYLETRDSKTLEKLYEIAKEISYNYINKYCQRRGIQFNNINDLSHDSAIFVIDQYLRKPDFMVLKISSYAYFGFKKTMFKDKDIETREVSYEECIENGRLYFPSFR